MPKVGYWVVCNDMGTLDWGEIGSLMGPIIMVRFEKRKVYIPVSADSILSTYREKVEAQVGYDTKKWEAENGL